MDNLKSIIAWEFLLIAVFASFLVIQAADTHNLQFITGRAVQGVTKESIQSELEKALPNMAFLKDVSDVSACIIVNIDPKTRYSYEIVQVSGVAAVTSSNDLYCRGQSNEDFIFSYVSYDKFKEQITNLPSFDEFRRTADGTNFYVIPSKQILSGLSLSNPKDFNTRFGKFLSKYFTPSEVQKILNPPTPQTASPASAVSYLFYFIVGGVVLVILIIVFVTRFSKKPDIKTNLELVSYIKSSFSQGFEEEQIRQSLVSSGWSDEEIAQALQTAKTDVIEPQTFA